MKTRMSKTRAFLLLGFIVLGAILGAAFIPTKKINSDILLNAGIGVILAATLCTIVFPELRNSYSEAWTKNNYHLVFMHPTQLPYILGIIWFITTIAFISLAKMALTIDQTWLFLILPITFIFGLSGLITVIRKESIGFAFPEFFIIRGIVAIVRGIVIIIIFWGFSVLMLLSIFHWK